jgi:hypothetical protein
VARTDLVAFRFSLLVKLLGGRGLTEDMALIHRVLLRYSPGTNVDLQQRPIDPGTVPISSFTESSFLDTLAALETLPDFRWCLDTVNQQGQTLLHLAVQLQYRELVQKLVEWGINLDIKDVNGSTALHAAYLCGDPSSIEILEKGGAATFMIDELGRMPHELSGPGLSSPKGNTSYVAKTQVPPSSRSSPLQQANNISLFLFYLSSQYFSQIAKYTKLEGFNGPVSLFRLDPIFENASQVPMHTKLKGSNGYLSLFERDLLHPPVNFLPALIPLADYKAAQDLRASKRVKTGLGTVYQSCLTARDTSAGDCVEPSAISFTPRDSSSQPSPEYSRAPTATAILSLPTPPSSRFAYQPDATMTTIDESAPLTLLPRVSASRGTNVSTPTPRVAQDKDRAMQETPLKTKKYSTQFRTPTGAGNNLHMPLLGASNTPYARFVPSMQRILPSAFPDVSVLFDALLRRTPPPPGDPTVRGQGHGQEHPNGISTLSFAFATLITHTLFRTSTGSDKNLNLTSSYLDLSVLYGNSEDEMNTVRRKDGTGRIWEDTWADLRIIAMVPAVGALMVVFSRNHNVGTPPLLLPGGLMMPIVHRHQTPQNKRKQDLRTSLWSAPKDPLLPFTTGKLHPRKPL